MSQALTKIQTGMISQQAQQALQGQTGATGATGASGQIGSTGPQGIQGNVGATGPIGATGQSITGATGPQGSQGPIGATGIKGDQGDQGATGIQGVQGATGPQGSTGVQGPVGATGVEGPTGPQGATGVTGSTGPVGATGSQGNIGSTGATGQAGATGVGDRYSTYSTTTLTIGNGTQSLYVEPGLGYTQNQPIIISHTGGTEHMHGVVNGYDKIGGGLSVDVSTHTGSGTFSVWTVNLEGAVGAIGATGAIGASGPQGATGIQGATGPKGDTGDIGATGTAGTNGATGPQGATGVKGDTGDQGATGVTGSQGATGTQGIQGLQGATGPVGATGLTGSTGVTGATGEMGPSGPQGVQGETGAMGATGATGPSGAQGATGIGSTGATGLAGDKYTTSSTNSLSLTTGSKSLTVAADLALSVGQDVIIAHDANNRMEGTISAYNSTTGALTVNVTHVLAGSGTYSSWAISLAGAVGQVGATGATGPSAPLLGGGILSPRFTGNGSTVAFGPLEGWDGPMNDEAGYLVYIDGVFQRPDEVNGGFTITGSDYASSQINFPSAIAADSVVDVLAIQVSGARGATGIQGATGPAGSGGSGDVGKAWSSSATYAIGDVVTQNHVGWVSLIDNNVDLDPGNQYGSPSWALIAGNAYQLFNNPITGIPTTGQTLTFDGVYWGPQTPVEIAGKAWSSSTTYEAGDIVSYNGGSGLDRVYIALRNNVGAAPSTSPSDWKLAIADAISLQSVAVNATTPTAGQALIYSGTEWSPDTIVQPSVASSAPSSDGGLASAGVTVAGWIDVLIGGNTYKMPYFQ